MTVTLLPGDALEMLDTIPSDSVDSCVTDPPYHLTSVVKRFGGKNAAPAQHGTDGAFARASRGFMGKQWDGGDIAFRPEVWVEVLRVLKPGAHLLAFGGTRTYHRMACAIEDAGFEIRDQIGWCYASGFPKSHDVSKGIDKAAGAERQVIGKSARHVSGKPNQRTAGLSGSSTFAETIGMGAFLTAPATDAAKQWRGWGTALKPAWEPIVVARKPLVGTVAENVLRFGTGAININGCRVATADDLNGGAYSGDRRTRDNVSLCDSDPSAVFLSRLRNGAGEYVQPSGRWPANLVHDGSDEVLAAFPIAPGQLADASSSSDSRKTQNVYGEMRRGNGRDGEASAERTYEADGSTNFAMKPGARRGDSGSAARFFYCAKATAADRAGSKHPTVKPLKLMRWLVRLVTPPGGVVLDPFAGTGTTGQAAVEEGFRATLIEREAEYQADIRRRIDTALAARV